MAKLTAAAVADSAALKVAGALLVFCCLVSASASAADWPTWRYDAGRTAASPARLPSKLHLQWTLQLPKTALAWPYESRCHFDACYEPVVMGKTLFIGSPNDGSVAAYDTETGEGKWKFYTEGPVRFAPVAWEGNVFAASDDGRLYCLAADTGSVKWIFRATPKDRPDLKHLGNNRLISLWPVRGGPLLVDGILYLGSGLWPTMGVFVYALNAGTGKLRWKNNRLNYLKDIRIDHNNFDNSGLSPQGYLVAEGKKLLVPNGRSMPAGLDLANGRFLFYVQGYRRGHGRTIAKGKYTFVGPKAVVNTFNGREVGSRYGDGGVKPKDFHAGQRGHWEGPYFEYKFVPGCDAWSVIVGAAAYGSDKGTFYGYDLRRVKTSLYEMKWGGTWKAKRWEPPLLWKVPTKYAKNKWPSRALIRAGRRLYGHAGKILVALDLPTRGGMPKVAWEQKLPDTPASMLAADRKLFVVTEGGSILCFGGKTGGAKNHKLAITPLAETSDAWRVKAGQILKATGARDGCGIVLGLENGRLVEELVGQSKLKVIGVDPDREMVNRLRDKLVAAGHYPKRLELFVGDPLSFGFPPYLANLIVSERYTGDEIAEKMTPEKLFNVLRPYGGVACLNVSPSMIEKFKARIANAGLENGALSQAGHLALLRRLGALKGSADWTHESADAARSYYSRDRLVKHPLGILWYGHGPDHGFSKTNDYGIGVKPQVVAGRLFALRLRNRTLYALDVYTGRLLWKTTVPRFTRYASMKDGVYVAGDDTCIVYDPAAGVPLKRFKFTAGGKPSVADIRVSDKVILIGVDFNKSSRNIDKGLWDNKVLVALDRKTGRQLWTRKAAERFNNHAIAMGDGLVFCIDGMSPAKRKVLKNRGAAPKTSKWTLFALEERTGKIRWRKTVTQPFNIPSYWVPIRGYDEFVAYSEECKILLAGENKNVFAFEAQTGKQLWNKAINGPQPMILKGAKFIHQFGLAHDLRTGAQLAEKKLFQLMHGGCNYGVGGEYLFFIRDYYASYIDAETAKQYKLRNARSGCSHSLVAANGVLSNPNFEDRCICNYPVQTAFAMFHMTIAGKWAGVTPLREGVRRR